MYVIKLVNVICILMVLCYHMRINDWTGNEFT